MALTKSSNPVLSEKIFHSSRSQVYGETMTVNGTVNKIAMLNNSNNYTRPVYLNFTRANSTPRS